MEIELKGDKNKFIDFVDKMERVGNIISRIDESLDTCRDDYKRDELMNLKNRVYDEISDLDLDKVERDLYDIESL